MVLAGSFNGCLPVAGAAGILAFAPMVMIVFRLKYPRWWFDSKLELLGSTLAWRHTGPHGRRYRQRRIPGGPPGHRVPGFQEELNRWLPFVKWFLAIPHYLVLVTLWIGAFLAVMLAWFAILITGRYPRASLRRGGCDPLAQPRDRIRHGTGHRPLSAFPTRHVA